MLIIGSLFNVHLNRNFMISFSPICSMDLQFKMFKIQCKMSIFPLNYYYDYILYVVL